MGVDAKHTRQLSSGPLHHGPGAPMGSGLVALGNDDMPGDKDGHSTAARKVAVVLLGGRCPYAVPSQSKASLSLTMDLVLVHFMLLNEEDVRLLLTSPQEGTPGTSSVGRSDVSAARFEFASPTARGGSKTRWR